MKIHQKYTDLIGRTPLLRLNNYEKAIGSEAIIVAKLESHNPLSSVKDRLAFALINAIEEKGLVRPDTVFIEPTSGNTGIGLAFICASKGYKLILTMPETVSKERAQIVRALGAEVILTDGTKGMKGAIAEATRLLNEHPNYIMPMQFENLANPEIHRRTTAIEILDDTEGKLDYFVAGVGTGGTLTGVGEVLKKKLDHVKVIAVEPKSSAVLSGEAPGPHKIQGIGAGFVPFVLNKDIIDEIIQIEDMEAFEHARLLAKTEGVFAGISSGATLAAATKLALRKENKGKMIVFIVADTGERYLTTTLWEQAQQSMFIWNNKDIEAAKVKDPAAESSLFIYFFYPGVIALRRHRRAHKLWKKGLRKWARYMSYRTRRKTGIDIHPGAIIGEGVFIDHGMGVVIGETAVVGDGCLLYQGVTLGAATFEKVDRHPKIGKNVTIYANASVIGNVKIGDNSVIYAHSLVTKDAPANSILKGVPAHKYIGQIIE